MFQFCKSLSIYIPELHKTMSGLVNGPARFFALPETNSLLNNGWTSGTHINSYLYIKSILIVMNK